jgi:hypothetical protein
VLALSACGRSSGSGETLLLFDVTGERRFENVTLRLVANGTVEKVFRGASFSLDEPYQIGIVLPPELQGAVEVVASADDGVCVVGTGRRLLPDVKPGTTSAAVGLHVTPTPAGTCIPPTQDGPDGSIGPSGSGGRAAGSGGFTGSGSGGSPGGTGGTRGTGGATGSGGGTGDPGCAIVYCPGGQLSCCVSWHAFALDASLLSAPSLVQSFTHTSAGAQATFAYTGPSQIGGLGFDLLSPLVLSSLRLVFSYSGPVMPAYVTLESVDGSSGCIYAINTDGLVSLAASATCWGTGTPGRGQKINLRADSITSGGGSLSVSRIDLF